MAANMQVKDIQVEVPDISEEMRQLLNDYLGGIKVLDTLGINPVNDSVALSLTLKAAIERLERSKNDSL